MIAFVCDGCHSNLQIGNEWVEKLGRCPHCGTNTRVPGNPKRTAKLTILARMVVFPFVLAAFWGLMFCIADVRSGFSLVLGSVIVGAMKATANRSRRQEAKRPQVSPLWNAIR